MEDNKRKLYDALSEDYDLGSFEQFSADIADETKRRKLYDAAIEDYDFGDFDSFSSQLGFGKAEPVQAAPAQAPAEEETVTENFDDQPDLRALNEKARKSAEKEQRKAEKEAEMAARDAQRAEERARRESEKSARAANEARRNMTPQERTRAFNQQTRMREAERESRIAEKSREEFSALKAAQRAEDEAFRARREQEKAERVRTEQDVQRFGTGNGNYSFEDAVSAGKEYEAIAPEVAGFEKRLADFNEKADLVNAGKLRLTPEQASEMQSEADALSGIAKRYDAVMNTAPGKEYKDISDRLTALAEGPKTADSAWAYAQAFASLERNPIYRASLGENAPSEDEINSNLLQGQIAYLEERMKSAKGSEKKELKKAYSDAKEALYANPWYKKQTEAKIAENQAENERIGRLRSERAAQVREDLIERNFTSKGKTPTAYDQSFFWQYEKGDPELQRLDAAAHMHDDAIREYKTPTKYDDSKGLGNVAKGLGNWATDTGTWSFGIEDFVEDIAVVRPVLEKVQSIVGNLNEDEVITEGNIKALEEQLTPGELAVLDAYFEKVGAKAAKGADTSIGYQIGQGIGDMVNLGIEMVATGGAGGAVRGAFEKGSKKALVKLLGKRAYRKAAQSGVGRVALWATAKIPADMVETAVRLPFMPSTYKALGEKSVELSSDYKVRQLTEYAPEAMWDQYVEQLTEVSNGFAFPLIGKVVKTPGMQKMIKGVLGENGSRALRAFMERGDIKLLDEAMIGSFGGEWEEELLGAVIHSVTDDPAALRDFFSAEQQLVLLGTLAPIPVTRGLTGGIALGVPSAKADIAWNRVERDMRSRGFDDARIARLKDVLDNAPVPEAAREAMNAYNDAVEGLMYTEDENPSLVGTIESAIDERQAGRFYEDLAHYFWATQQKRAVGLVGEIQKDEALAAKREELNNLYGTFSYEREMSDGSKREVVETATMTGADGNPMNVLLLSDSMDSNEVAYVSQDGTQHGFVDPSADPGFLFGNVIEADRYLARLIMQDGQVEQAEQVIGEAAAVNESLRQQVESLPEITFYGTTGSLVRKGEDGAVFVPDDGTDNIPVTWEELAMENGIAVPEVTTDAEKTEAGVAEVDAHLQAKAAIADSFNEALDSGFDEAVIDTDDGPAHVIGIIEDSIDPDAGTAQFTVQLADGSRSVTMSIPIEPILSQLRGETSAEPAPEAEPEAEPEAAPVEEPAPEEPEETAPKIPLDKNGNPIYDAPGVSVEDALEDMYSTEGLDEADVDEYIINKANETDKARNVKQGKMSLKEWGQAKKEANRVADFWAELREFAEENKRAREADEKKDAERQKLIEKYGVDTSKFDLTPQTLQEAVAEYILTPGIISLSDAIKHVSGRTKSGRVPAEMFRHLGNGGILSKKGGASISDVAADVVREFYGDLEHDDEQDEARDYIIDFLWRNTKSEIRDFIFNNRLEEARRMAEREEEPEPEILEPAPEPVKAEEPAPEPEPETTVEEPAGESAAEETEVVEDLPEEEEEPEPEPAPVPEKPEPNPPAPAAPEVPEPRTAPEGDILLSDLTDVIDPWVVERLEDAGFTTAREVLAADMGAVALDADLDFDTLTELYVILRRELGISSEAPASVEEQIEEAREQVDTNPTEAQKEAGNYRKGHVTIDGMDITIENPKGSVRSGVDSKGNKWSVTMNNDYGYIRMTEGVDGDHIDVFLSDTPSEGKVFVVDQVNPDTGEFDEHKVMYGFNSEQEAREAYLANYSEGWKGLGDITEVTKEEFAKWIDSSKRKTKPFAEYAAVKNAGNTSESRGKSVTSQVKEEAPQPAAPSELTEEEIRNSGYPDEDIIDAAVDYINGDKSFANTAAYKLIKDYVGSQRGATEQTGGDADGAQLDGRGVRTSGMGADAGGGEAGAVGGGQSETPAERIPGPADGRVPSGEGSPASPAGEGLPADVPDSGGNGRGGRGGAREPGRSHDDGRGQAEPAPQPQQPARREIEAGSTDIDALGGELEDLLKQFGATDMSVERQAAPGLETMSYSEAPESETKEEGLLSRKQPKKPTVPLSMDGLTPKQMDLAGKIIFSSAKLGYAFAKTEGLTTFNDFRRWFKGKFGDAVMKGLNYDESSLDAFIREVWSTKMKIDGERRTLEQHASELHNAELRAMAEKTIPQRKQEQAAANEKGVKPIPGNRRNIAEALPMLVPGQWDDVVAIERQFFDPSHDDYDHAYGKGMLITNGTGTGKTFTGLGTIKRFLDMGKKRILLVCPAGMVTEWTEKAQLMGIKMTRLADTKDKGEGVVATSYQNFRENRALYEGEFDLVVYDESQNIIENQQGEDTLAYEAHKRITNKDVESATERLLGTTESGRRRNELLAEQRSLETESKKASTTEQRQAEIVIRTEEIENEIEQLNAQLNLLKPKFREQAEAAVKRTKVLFLSATPFNTVNNLKYAEGYIYQYPKVYRSDKTEVTDEEARRSAFITEWFRGDEPMEEREIAFGDHLLDELETASFRELENGYDHSRDFPDVSGNVMASRFNAAWQAILGDPRFRSLKDAAEDILKDRTWSTQLFETMKVSAIRDRLKEHLDAGRKIVIFHDRMHETKAGGKKDMPPVGPPFAAVLDRAMNQKGTPPTMAVMLFRSAFADVLNWEQTLDYRPVHEQIIDFYATDADRAKYAKKHEEWEKKMEQWRKDCDEFERQHPTWSQEKIYEKMPKAPKEPKLEAESVVTYNGERTEKEKEAAKAAFNDDNSKVKIICVTTKSGGAGLSLHDTTGKFPRVMIQTALPVSPIGFIQAEGRIFRWGNRSNAVFEYPRLGINLEAWVFAVNFNAKAETVENLAHGFRGRGLKDSIMTGFYENAGNVPIDGQGIGGVEMDRRGNTLKGMAKAKHDFGVAQRKGIRDFDHSIPEPVGFKMAEWAMVQSGDNALIPFAGRGSIARYMPKGVSVTAMEPDSSLQADLMITSGSEDFKIRDGLFTELSQINKADVVLMNGHTDGGLNEVETMRKGFMHLSEGGRLIAVVPANAEADYTITDLASSGGVLRASIKVSNEALGRGKGTSRIVVIDKITKTDLRKKAGTPINEDLSNASQEDLFGLIDSIKAPERIIDKQAIAIKKIKSVLTELRKNKLVGEINVLDEENQKARIQFNMADRFPKGLTRSRYRFDSFHNSGWYYTGKWFTVRYSEFAEPTPNSELIKAYQWLKEVVDITDSNEFRRRADIESGAKEESIELMRELYRQYMRFIRAGYGLTETQIQRVAQGLRPDVSAADIDTLTSYDELRAKFEITNHDDEERLELYGKVAKVGEKIGLKIGAKAMDRDFLGGYNNVENSLTINKIRWNGLSDEKRAQTLLHELIHSVTVYAIAGYDTNAPGMSDELFNAAKLASDVYDQIQKGTAEDVRPFVGQYAIENAKELLAEMANPEVKEKLMKRRMWVTRSSRGIRVSGAAMEGAELTDAWTLLSEALDGMLEHFDKDLFDRFKGRVSDFFWSVSRDGIYSRPADASRQAPFEGDATLVRDRVLEDEVDEDGVLYRKLDDPEKVAELESEPKVKVYRSMQMVDGKLYPPMSAKVDGKWREPIELGVWEEAEEHPEMADENGEFVLDKGDGSGPMKVAYAPYIHTRRSPLNEQFSSAYNRPNLVIVESEIPESELSSNYTAERSMKSTGEHDWPSGKVSNELAKQGKNTRKVILSRWAKPLRVLPASEVADIIAELIGDSDIAFPYNVVTPSLRAELQRRGVRFDGWQGNRPKNVDELIDSMQERLYRRADDLRNPIDRASAIAKAMEIAGKLGVKFKEDPNLKAKGAFYPKTGEIRVNVDAHKGTDDLVATILHETVAHFGFRKMFGKEWKDVRHSLYEGASVEVRARVDEIAKKDGLSKDVAMEEYIAELAEDGRFTEEEETFWDKVVRAVKRLLAKLGINVPLNDADFRSLLYDSYRNLQSHGAVEQAKVVATSRALREAADRSHDDDEGPEDDGPGGGLRRDSSPVFFSNAEAAVRRINMGKATPEQWLKMIEKEGGLKAGEDKWIGLSDWLKSSDRRTLTKQEVLDYVIANEISLEEQAYVDPDNRLIRATTAHYVDRLNKFIRSFHDKSWNRDPEKFAMFQMEFPDLAEREERGEVAMRVTSSGISYVVGENGYAGDEKTINETRKMYTTKGLSGLREIALTVPTVEPYAKNDKIHFGDAGGGRVVAWVRFGETTDAEGHRVLVIDEIQSKRHQDAREKGYASDELKKLEKEYDEFVEETAKKHNVEVDALDDVATPEEKQRAKEFNDRISELRKQGGVPDAPFEKNWQELAMKRALRYAAENGYDYMAWTTGNQQAERYDIGQVVSSIGYDEPQVKRYETAPSRHFVIRKQDGNKTHGYVVLSGEYAGVIQETFENGWGGEKLSDVVGKALAEQIINATGSGSIEGEGLRIGGEGMRSFYDEILPRFMGKYGKKWGVKVEDIVLPKVEQAGRVMHAVPVTAEMRASVLDGQPLFRKADMSDVPEDMARDARRLETDQETEVLYRRSSSSSTAQTAAEMYNSRVRTIGSAIGEVLVDEYVPVDKLMEALEAESGVKLRDSERVSEMMRETGGRAMYAIRDYNHRFLEPMWDAVGEFRKLTGDSMEDTEVYIGLKSGLERNVVLAARDAKRDYQAQYDSEIDKINKEEKDKKKALDKQLKAGTISDVTYQGELTLLQQEMKQKRDDAANKLNGHFADVDAGTDSRFLEYRKKDYSAITTWAETEDLEEAERLAGEYVAARENLAGTDATDELWKRINAATKETLRFQYEHQMLSKQQYSDISKMMKFYVPMRGFAEDTAEDLFNYYVTAQSNDFQATLLNAKGRTTMYEGPLGNIGAMHSSAISQGIKNEAKLSLLDAVRRRKDNTIATVTRAWFVKNGQKDANGKDIYEVAYPQIPEGATFSERQAIIEQFENDMADAKSRGDAFNAHREVDLHGGVVAFEREAHKNEHIVTVREGGKEYGIIINGNPAAAQAINGVRRTNGAGEKFLGIMRNWTRFLSSMFTTFSVPFWVSNFQRDHGQGLTNAFIRNTPGYVGAYIKNRMRAAKLFPLILGKETMDKALAKGDAVAVLYKQYIENGGPMGQNRIEDNEYFERQMKRYLDNSTRQGVIKGATAVLDVIGGVGEAIETITRFATFMTSMEFGRPIHESISDAKEISTNFARKGSGRSFSRDELDRMTHADGRKLTNLEKHFVNAVSIGVEICRATIPFFNAAVQGLENKVTNYREHTGKTLLADSIYLMLGLGMNLLLANAGGDDDKEKYSHTSDYLRRNNILNPLGNGVYAKWALPQEYRVMYAMGDILGSAIRQERPIEDLGADAFGALMQLSPIGAVTDEVAFSPENKKKAYETLITNVSPGVVAPVLESIFNMDFKGARIYNEGFNENLRAYPGWTKALPTTGKEYVAMAKFLNELTGGNDVERGWVNINPAIVEHLVESYFSGPYQIVVRAPEAAIKAVNGEATVRDIPLLNRIVLNTNDNQRDAYYSNMYYYFKEKNTEAERIHSEYKGRPKEGKVADFYQSDNYKYMLVFSKYDKVERELRKASKLMAEKGDEASKEKYDEKLQNIQYQIAKECLDIYFDR